MMKCFVGLFLFFMLSPCSFFYGSEKSKGSFRILILYNPHTSRAHKSDAEKIKKTFEGIASSINMPLHVKKVDSRTFSRKKIQQWAKHIHQSEDITFVYYSGHEGCFKGGGSWPTIPLGRPETPLAVDILATYINTNHPKLSIVVADCYDNVVDLSINLSFPFGKPIKKTRDKELIRDFRKTWLHSSGTLTLCSHSLGEAGHGIHVGSQYKGGLLTEVLLRLLEENGKLSAFPTLLQNCIFTCRKIPSQHILSHSSATN